MGVVNIKNEGDDYCHIWSIIAHIHIVDKDPDRLYHYKKYVNDVNITCLQFPHKHADVPKFEKINPSISINVLCF